MVKTANLKAISFSQDPIYLCMGVSKSRNLNIDPKYCGSFYKDGHKKDPQSIETAIWVVVNMMVPVWVLSIIQH